jgi:hypothetical protein
MRTSRFTEEQINKGIDRFGGCPECHDYDEQLNVYKIHWFVCHCHKTRWSVGCNLFDSWRHENESVWLENSRLLVQCREVEPWPQLTFRERAVRWWWSRRAVRAGAELIGLLRRFGRPEYESHHHDQASLVDEDEVPF